MATDEMIRVLMEENAQLKADLEQAKRNLQQVEEHHYQAGYRDGEAVAYLAALEACRSELQRLLNIDDNSRERIDDIQDLHDWLDQQIAQAKETT